MIVHLIFYEINYLKYFNDYSALFEYGDSLKNFRDIYSVITTAELKGEARGRTEGLAKGHAKGSAEGKHNALCRTALVMKERGLAPDAIADITGLSLEEIQEL